MYKKILGLCKGYDFRSDIRYYYNMSFLIVVVMMVT